MPAPDLSICIVSWNTRTDLEQALKSILRVHHSPDVQVVVLDNSSRDGSADMVRQLFPEVTLIESRQNLGFARGYNRAAAEAAARHLLLVNPDTVVHPGALQSLVAFLDSHPEAGAVGPRLLNPDGSLQFSCRRFPTPAAAIFRNTFLGRVLSRNRFTRDYLMADWDHRTVREVDWISGAAMCVPRTVWEEVGGFDQAFFMYAEDMDWCLRARQAGYRIYYLPEAAITHRIGGSSDQRPLAMVVQFHRSMARFYRKHYAPRWPWGLRWIPVAGICARAAFILSHTLYAEIGDQLRLLRRRRA